LKVAFKTLGCKLNYSETSSISREFVKKGYEKVSFDDASDIYVINTCSVTQNADKEFKYLVNKVKRKNPNSSVVAIGCYAQLKPKKISEIPGVDLVLGADKKFDILNYLNLEDQDNNNIHSCEINSVDFFKSSYSLGDRTRSFLKVQDGCDYKCTYCTIPQARGKSRSGTISEILDNVKHLVASGVKEIVLTGVNIGDYGIFDTKTKKRETNFHELISNIDLIPDLNRVRISSIEPNLLSDEIIQFVHNSNSFVKHFHIPLQSGSDKILKLMKRRYLKNLYISRINKIKELMPDCCIGVDVIVGFPGETEEDFNETYEFLKALNISYLHVFSYSERDNTESLKINHKIPKKTRAIRSQILRKLSDKKKMNFYESNINQIRPVLFESKNYDGYIYGYTDNYIRVKTLWSKNLVDNVVDCELIKIDDGIIMNAKVYEKETIALHL
jgi:threonylcarbamoyladenosine tRNA methylthiotransferase MtaB